MTLCMSDDETEPEVSGAGPPQMVETLELWELPSHCQPRGSRSIDRADPYYSGAWSTGAIATWSHRDGVEVAVSTGADPRLHAPIWPLPEVRIASTYLLRHVTLSVKVLGALAGIREGTTAQLAAVAGSTTTAKVAAVLVAAYAAGMVDMGRTGITGTFDPYGDDVLWRPRRSTEFDRFFVPQLSYLEWLALTGGIDDWGTHHRGDRHNVLACELLLRTAEHLEIGTVLGERHSGLRNLMPNPPAGRGHHTRSEADLTIVRPDGLRIAVELTANTNGAFARTKVDTWLRALQNNRLGQAGVVCLFLTAPAADTPLAGPGSMKEEVTRAIARSAYFTPAVAELVAVVDWREWFPRRHVASDWFAELRVDLPLLAVEGQRSTTSLLRGSRYRTEPRQAAALQCVIPNSAVLAQTPHWIRARLREPALPVQRVLNDAPLPKPSPARPGRPAKQLPLGAASGAASQAGVPRRVQGLAD